MRETKQVFRLNLYFTIGNIFKVMKFISMFLDECIEFNEIR